MSTSRLIAKLIATGFALAAVMTGVSCIVGGAYVKYRESQANKTQEAPGGCGATAPPPRP